MKFGKFRFAKWIFREWIFGLKISIVFKESEKYKISINFKLSSSLMNQPTHLNSSEIIIIET
jgi:hypothetical protein